MDDPQVSRVASGEADGFRHDEDKRMGERLFWTVNLAVMVVIVLGGGVAIAYVMG